jgi:hypothetical protein
VSTEDTNPAAEPGRTVLIRATVLEHISGVGYRVELFSKADQYEAWIREDQVAHVVPGPVAPPEPADGTRWIGADGATYERHDTWASTSGLRRWYNTNSGGPDTWAQVWRMAQPSEPLIAVPANPADPTGGA